jgi:carboxypeptidase Taq
MSKPNSAYSELRHDFEKVGHIEAAQATLFWEARTYMPEGGHATRGKVLSTLTEVVAESMHAPRMGDLLSRAEEEEGWSLEEWEAANLREMRRKWRHETAIPAKLASRLAELSSVGQSVWEKARANNDFAAFAPTLTEIVAQLREVAAIKSDAFGVSPYNAMLDEYEPGLTTETVDPIFDDLAAFLPPLMQQIMAKQAAEPAIMPLTGPFPPERQMELCKRIAAMIGFDFHHGRMDTTAHPFACGIPGDVRITTRFDPEDITSGIMATIHETGHAMYEAGLPADWAFQPVGRARGAAMHESQSLLTEMQAGRSAQFLPVLFAMLRDFFGDGSEAWSNANLMRIYRKVGPIFIRVDADEVTYPLHVIMRYRLEKALLLGDLEVADLPAAWNESIGSLLGIVPPTDTLGCLQDVHWSAGLIGYFPTYSIGAVTAAQLFAAARQQEPAIDAGLARGDFSALVGWTRSHIHSQGSRFATSGEVVETATGRPLSTDAFKAHLRRRYLEELEDTERHTKTAA